MRLTTAIETRSYPWKEIPGSSHQLLLARVLEKGTDLAVLDLGFGAGLFARRIRDRCRYLAGIELDPEAAREGAPYFDDPIQGDLLEGLAGPWREPFDLVVAGDVLEHLPGPGEALQALRGLLKPSGSLLCSLPNVANVTVRLALLFGRFDYAPRGILDGTHLRFYTRRTARELLEANGFRIVDERTTAMPIELALPLLGRRPVAPLVRSLALLLARLGPGLFGYQFVFEAVPA